MYNEVMKNKLIRSVAEFMAEFRGWVTQNGGENMLYRGLTDESQKAEASLHRRLRGKSEFDLPKTEFIQASEYLVGQAKLRGYARDHAGEWKDLQLMGRLQHYGAATCLIDFTRNPLVALWFACQPSNQEDNNAKKGNDADGKVVAVDSSDPDKYKTVQLEHLDYSLEDFMKADNLWKWRPENLESRVIAQHSEFIFGDSIVLTDEHIIIPFALKADILRELEKNDISEERLFPDFYGFAQINAHDRPYRYRESADNYASLAAQAAQSGDDQGAIHWYDVAIKKDRNNPNWFNNRGNAKKRLGDYEDAIADYDRVIKLTPQNADAYYNRGLANYELGNYNNAIPDFDRAIEINPQEADAYYNRGLARRKSDDLPGAIADYDRVIEINPQDANAYYNRGNAKRELDDYKGAIADYDRAIEINPQDADAYNNRGNAKYELDDYKGAIPDFDRAIEINPQFATAYYNRGNAKKQSGDLPSAIADYDRTIELDSDYAPAYGNRGNTKRQLGDLPGAIADYGQVLRINSQDALAYYNRAIAKEQLGDLPGAIADYDRTTKINPRFAEAYHNRGIVKQKSGDKEGATADLQKSKELEKNASNPEKE